MKVKLILTTFFISLFALQVQSQNDWASFENATFKDIFVKEFFSFKSLLVPDEQIAVLEGKTFEITGYYIPVATQDSSIILSKTPFASCFFCGSAGQETVLDVRLSKPSKRNYLADDKISVKGVLKINSTDWETLSFILEEAVIVKD